ncbi:MAG: hypothetical protein ACRYFB_15545 [Janthinobacterium lividum]
MRIAYYCSPIGIIRLKETGYAGGLWRKKWLLQPKAVIYGKAQTTLF